MPLKKVLIVDDSATMRKIIARVLRQADIALEEVIEASNGIEGLERLAADPGIQLVMSDLNMPGMDGLTFVRTLRETRSKESLPMIIVTTEGGKSMMQAALDGGANGYVTKPFNSDTVRLALEEYLAEQRTNRHQPQAAIAAQELLRGLQSAVDQVFATMLSTLGVGTRLGDPCRSDIERGREHALPGAQPDPTSIRVEARVDIQGPLQGWICLSCTAQAADDLARDLLRLGPSEVLSRAEVEDALGECANMVAGVLKTAMLDTRGCYAISTPRLSAGKSPPARPRGTLAYRLCAGSLNAELWLDLGQELR